MRKEICFTDLENVIKNFNKCFDCSFCDYIYFMNNVVNSNISLKDKQSAFIQCLEVHKKGVK